MDIVIDTSALIAVIVAEPEREKIVEATAGHSLIGPGCIPSLLHVNAAVGNLRAVHGPSRACGIRPGVYAGLADAQPYMMF
ncbi:MAG: type II toxin-antitoxin system VapC family toxin [Planctomycetes bacterium]|nr:type II toxin-antitoxin system VapC family toxin [Planctomycetota bacterium]MBU4400732.1 type II toxin-antitoxin system VapC family toxin [Planctomycetota bacterium]MCG2683818.1 type II toxin-antitoxin system VapC family toxin [Planctomycetales bacterium]